MAPSSSRATPSPRVPVGLTKARLFGLFALGLAAALGQAACGFPEYGGFADGAGGATASGTGGAGGHGACATGFAHCTSNAKDTCETDLLRSVDDCGKCGNVCPKVGGTASCNAGQCEIACDPGLADCDGNLKNGCEVDTTKNVDHCGGCGKVCPDVGGTPSCVAGKCGVSKCDDGFGNCDGDAKNGCEASFTNDKNNCGACGKVCVAANGTGKCVGGECAVDTCDKGFGDCDGDYTTGCETATDTDAQNCGACKNACTFKNAAGVCKAGVCGLGDCEKGFADCDLSAANGCEVSTDSDAKNCGACKTVCGSVHGLGVCQAGGCTFQCQAGWDHCNPLPAFGCDTQVTQDLNNCGSCGNVCTVANGSASCAAKKCAILSCNAGFKDCDGLYETGCEAQLLSDVNNCGACGKKCVNANGGSTTCTNGLCTPSCGAGSADCDKNPDNGCEVSTKDDVSNCGACGKVCGKQNTSASSCANGSCNITCSAGFSDCDGLTEDGCESSTATDVNNCGGCNVKCTNPNGSTSCSSGKCLPVCNANTKDCDGNVNNGCEANTKTDANNCGGCGIVCPANQPQCLNGACFGDCPLDAYEPNNSTWWPQALPVGPNQKPLEPGPGTDVWPLSGRTAAFQASFTNNNDVDVYYAKIQDDYLDMREVAFNITLLNVPAGATYSITAYWLCTSGDQQDGFVYNANPAQCTPGQPNTSFVNGWFGCEKSIPASSGTLAFGVGCTVGSPGTSIANTSGVLEIQVKTVTPPANPTCSPYSLSLQTYSIGSP